MDEMQKTLSGRDERVELAKAAVLDYFERGESGELLSLGAKYSQMIEPFEWSPERSR